MNPMFSILYWKGSCEDSKHNSLMLIATMPRWIPCRRQSQTHYILLNLLSMSSQSKPLYRIRSSSSVSGNNLVKSMHDSGFIIPVCSKNHHFPRDWNNWGHNPYFFFTYSKNVTINVISSFSSVKCRALHVLALFFIHPPIPSNRLPDTFPTALWTVTNLFFRRMSKCIISKSFAESALVHHDFPPKNKDIEHMIDLSPSCEIDNSSLSESVK